MRKVKIGMISFAHSHANTYLSTLLKMPDVEIAGIADEQKSRVERHLQKYGFPYFPRYEDLLQSDADAVIICSENVRHAPMTIASAKAGKHILCEKPLGISKEEMRQMIDACKEHGVQLMTAFPNRYVPAVMEAKKAVERGELGKLIAIKGTNKGAMPGQWFIERELSGGGAMLDHSVHVMDLMNWMLQSTVNEVYAESGTLFHDIDIDDAGMVHVKYDSGVFAVLDTSWSRSKAFPYGRDLSMEIIGTEGTLFVDDTTQVNEVYREDHKYSQWSFWGEDRNYNMVRDFVTAIRDNTPVPITGEDGFKSAVVAFAAYESARLGKPVKL